MGFFKFPQKNTNTNSNNNTLDVRNFGAKGDGIANDTTAIQKAIDASKSGLNTTISFPKGTYRITSPLIIANVSGLYIEGNGSVIKGNRHDLFRVENSTNINIQRLKYDQPITAGAARFFRAIKVSHVALVECHINSGAFAYFLSSYDDQEIDYNDKTFWNEYIKLDRCTASGEYLVDNVIMCQKTNNLVMTQCVIEKGTGDGLKFNGGDSENIYVSYCEFRNLGDDGIDMFGSGRFLHISDNYFHNIRGYPANLKLSGDAQNQGGTSYKAWFVNNRVENNALGLGLSNGKNILIQSNVFKRCGIDPIDGTKYSHMIRVDESAEDIRFIDNDFIEIDTKTAVLTLEQVEKVGETNRNLHSLIQGNRWRNNQSPYLLYIGNSASTANRMIDVSENLFDGIKDRAIAVQMNIGSTRIRNNRFINGTGTGIQLMTLSNNSKVIITDNISELSGTHFYNNTSITPDMRNNSWN